jgi:hypothetical protein
MTLHKPLGRPKLPAEHSRKPGLSFRLKPAEQQEIELAIEASGLSKSEWIRAALLAKARSQRR